MFEKNPVTELFMHRRGFGITVFRRKIKHKKEGKRGVCNPSPTHQNPRFLPTVQWERTEIPTNVSDITEKMSRKRLKHGPTASEPCCSTLPWEPLQWKF